MPRTIKLVIEYDGTGYGGWQRQTNAPSVQAAIEDRLREMTREPALFLRGAGRTDAGVHALGQVASFRTEARIPAEGFRKGVTALLPRDIAVVAAEEMDEAFDARFSARGKLYRYRILSAPSRAPLRDRFVWHVQKALDLERMRAAARHLVGRLDFAAFRASDCERRTTVRTLDRLDIFAHADEIVIEVEGDAFLKNMVRILAGTLSAVGRGEVSPDEVARIRDTRDRTQAGMTAPARGLTLVHVRY